MTDINDLIKEKLTKFPANINKLAIEAIKLSSDPSLPEVTIADQLGNVVRQIVKKNGNSE